MWIETKAKGTGVTITLTEDEAHELHGFLNETIPIGLEVPRPIEWKLAKGLFYALSDQDFSKQETN